MSETPVAASDDDGCHILHVDMDAFFAAVEVRERPELRGKPVIIGHAGGRGVVTSATYEARALGVHSAMPMSRALRLAPHAVVVEPSHHKYTEVSAQVMTIFESVTPLVQPLSIDEAFLDVSGAMKLIGSPTHIAQLIRKKVWEEQHITCSVGIASTLFVAKLATNAAKPDGIKVVPHDRVIEFLHPLPINALWGVGDKTAEQLSRLGLRTVADIAHTPLPTLIKVVGDAQGRHLYELSWGRDPRRVTAAHPDKSISAERTFDHDIDDPEFVLAHVLDLSEKVARRLRAGGHTAKTIAIKVRFADFTTVTRSKSLASTTDVGHEIYATARALFEAMHLQRARIRLVGVRCEGLDDSGDIQMSLSQREFGWRETEQVMDQVAEKFGNAKVIPARLVQPHPDRAQET
ncbi:MAG: DNA polymerase IV [Actinomycetes bacterium]